MIPVQTSLRNRVLPLLIFMLVASAVSAGNSKLDQAIELYENGKYAEALPLLETLAAKRKADGVTLYRLYYCQRQAEDPKQTETLLAARTALEQQFAAAPTLEAAFYLSTVYTNLNMPDDVARITAETTTGVSSGKIPQPKTAVDQFRLGKLHVDQGQALEAGPWLQRAVDGFVAANNASHRPYLVWAARWLGSRAIAEERYEVAADMYQHVLEANQPTLEDLTNLGFSSLMIGRYDDAAQAWQLAAQRDPGEADRYRYGSGLANLASISGELPISPDGERSWEETSVEELETILRNQAAAVRSIRTEIEATKDMKQEARVKFEAQLATERPMFVAAALEYIGRGLNLREAAFFGGYAPLIFHDREWKVINAAPRRWTPAEIQELRKKTREERGDP